MGTYSSYADGNPPQGTDIFLVSRNGGGTRRFTYTQLVAALNALYEAAGAVTAHVAAGDPHTQYALEAALGTMSTQNANNVAITGGAVSDVDLNLKDETVAAEGDLAYNATTEELNYHNGQWVLTDAVGWEVYVGHLGASVGAIGGTANVGLTTSGGSVALPVRPVGHMLLQGIRLRCTDTANLREAEWRLFRQRLNNGNAAENTLNAVTGADGTFSFTPTGISLQASAASGAPVYLAPGLYWLVIRNTSSSQTFGVNVLASSAWPTNCYQTKPSLAALGATLDFVAATWTRASGALGVALQGRAFGETAAF